jgi:hypothetical protein
VSAHTPAAAVTAIVEWPASDPTNSDNAMPAAAHIMVVARLR